MPGLCSIHANSARDAIGKLCTLLLLAGRNIDSGFVRPAVASCVDLVVHCELDRSGRRQVAEIIAVGGSGESHAIEASTLFELRDGELRATGRFPLNDAKYRAAGISLASILAVGER